MSSSNFTTTVVKDFIQTHAQIWSMFTDPKKLDSWFSGNTTIDLEVGGRYKNEDGDNWLIAKIVSGKSIDWDWENKGCYTGSHLRFEVTALHSGGRLTITQTNLSNEAEVQSQTEGWTWALHSLESYLNTGKRVRYSDWELAGKPE